MKSPCRKMCTLNEDDLCLGCGRLLAEITSWTSYSDQQRAAISEQCKRRLSDLTAGGSPFVAANLKADKNS
ncbi:MAG: DUF1289 domain-containing protein [Cycloclasticus sp.]